MTHNLKPISNFHELDIAIKNNLVTYEEAQYIEDMLLQQQADNFMDSVMQGELLTA